MLEIVVSNQFKRDLILAKKRGFNINSLKLVVYLLARQEKLDEKYRDHNLGGEFKGCRECHIEPGWLLIYQVVEDALQLLLLRTGTHADLF